MSGVLFNYNRDGVVQRLTQGEALHIKPGQIHRFAAMEGNVDLIEVSTNHLDDVVRLEDDYQRE